MIFKVTLWQAQIHNTVATFTYFISLMMQINPSQRKGKNFGQYKNQNPLSNSSTLCL